MNYRDPSGTCTVTYYWSMWNDGSDFTIDAVTYTGCGGGGGIPQQKPAKNLCSVPLAPPDGDVKENMEDIRWLPMGTLPAFYNLVKPGGPWDYKRLGKNGGQLKSPYEEFGNFNYGATGVAAGIPPAVLLRMAGWVSRHSDPSNARFGHPLDRFGPFGDHPQDQEIIERGINYAKAVKARKC